MGGWLYVLRKDGEKQSVVNRKKLSTEILLQECLPKHRKVHSVINSHKLFYLYENILTTKIFSNLFLRQNLNHLVVEALCQATSCNIKYNTP